MEQTEKISFTELDTLPDDDPYNNKNSSITEQLGDLVQINVSCSSNNDSFMRDISQMYDYCVKYSKLDDDETVNTAINTIFLPLLKELQKVGQDIDKARTFMSLLMDGDTPN